MNKRTYHPVFGQITPTYLSIALGMVLVGWQAEVGTLSVTVQWIVFASLLVSVGIPHGALDHLIARETASRAGKTFSLSWFVVRYLLIMIVYGTTWFLFPGLSLGLFLLMSIWHFGETDIERVPSTLIWSVVRLMVGGFVLAFILLTHPTEVTPVLKHMTLNHLLIVSLWQTALSHSWLLLWGWGLLTVCLFRIAFQQSPVIVDWLRLARLAIILALGFALPLLLAFGLYFSGWHALNSFQMTYGYLQHSRRPKQPVVTAGQIWMNSLPLTAIALAFCSALAWWWPYSTLVEDPLRLFFVFLSLITLPHLCVLHIMNNQLKATG
ncbi:Brp/Blh family beta-carotene 15,15'-dioxygenase [Spirosoma flavum]|uniref:Probable beta-carotene 15,15'-dioxygenase n=1 Tax=Spirosoma flavum TaxID=2048557 RepID=A0ABW6ATD7_9BACT